MCRSTANVLICIVSLALAACGGAGAGSSSVPATSQALSDVAANARIRKLLQTKIKHVFVLVQENHTFDQLYGLFPGVNGQTVNNLGTYQAEQTDCQSDPVAGGCQRPFLISANQNSPSYVPDAPDISGGYNGRYDQQYAIDHGKMDDFLVDVEAGQLPLGPTPSPQQIEQHNEDIAIEGVYDCNTVPYLWYYAKNFALFDNYFQAETGDSAPSNVQLFSAQFGQTEAVLGEGILSQPLPSGGGYTDGVPLSNDDNPPPSSLPLSITGYTGDASQAQSYATLPVLLSPSEDRAAEKSGTVGYDGQDIDQEAKAHRANFGWAWYQEGTYTSGAGFVAHHNAPLYFNYINSANSGFASTSTLRDNTQSNGLISDIVGGKLPSEGVFWVKGGTANTYGLVPADPIFTQNSLGKKYYIGDDDHPGSGDADHQVAEAYLAELINAIAQSKYWKDSVIIVTWDDSGGFYDHAPPPSYGATCPQDKTGPEEGYSCGDGVRLPALVISAFSKTGVVVHHLADHGSVSKFIEAVFGLPKTASLPDEAAGVKANLAPADDDSATSDLFEALDESKLEGNGLNPPKLAEISSPGVPPSMSCATLGVTPIPAPTSLPNGYATAGYYLHQSLEGSPLAAPLPAPRDDGD